MIAEVKAKDSIQLWDLEREKWILQTLREMSEKQAIPWNYLQSIYHIMFSLSITHQAKIIGNGNMPNFSNAIDFTMPFLLQLPNNAKLRITFQGELGAFSHLAISSVFPKATAIPSWQFDDVKEKLDKNIADLAILPFFNTIAGTVNLGQKIADHIEHVVLYKFPIKIRHMLAVPNHIEDIGQIETVYSHPEALRQCKNFLTKHGIRGISYHDTAGAAKMIAEYSPQNSAALCSEMAANLYGLHILKRDVQDIKNNFTFFALVAKTSSLPQIVKQLVEFNV